MLSSRATRTRYPSEDLAPARRPRPIGGALHLRVRFFLACWACFLVFGPIYVFQAGLPQPADGLMAVMILALATGYFVRAPIYANLYLVASIFLGYIALVNWFWYGLYPDSRLLLSSVYYVYNFGVVVVAITLLAKFDSDFIRTTRFALAASLALEVVACILLPGGASPREIGTFHNPNQLGYWSLATLSCWLILKRDRPLGVADLAVIAASGELVALALSKAALVAYFVLVIFGLFAQGLHRRLRWPLGFLIVIAVPLLVFQPGLVQDLFTQHGVVANVIKRLEGIGKQADDSAEGRNYDRIWRFPEYLLLGSGEGAYERFSRTPAEPSTGEMHSTLGTILFCYGMVGLTMFGLLLYQIFRKALIRHFFYFGPLLMYGMTHQGLRLTSIWLALGLSFRSGQRDLAEEERSPLQTGRIEPAARRHVGARTPGAARWPDRRRRCRDERDLEVGPTGRRRW